MLTGRATIDAVKAVFVFLLVVIRPGQARVEL